MFQKNVIKKSSTLKILLFLCVTSAHAVQHSSLEPLFSDQPNAQYYWQALVQVGKNNKQAALDLVAQIQTNTCDKPLENLSSNSLENFLDYLFITEMSYKPQLLSKLGLFESIGIRDHNAYLDDVSVEATQSTFVLKKHFFQKLQEYVPPKSSDPTHLSYEFVTWTLKHAVDGEPFLFHDYKVTQMIGALTRLADLMTQFHRLEYAQDVHNYLERLKKIPVYLEQVIDFVNYQESLGIVIPAFAQKKIINVIDRSTPQDISQNFLYQHLVKHIQSIADIDKETVLALAYDTIKRTVYPAYKNLKNCYEMLQQNYPENNGVWALPNGDAYYAFTLQHHTTTDMSADEIYELGLREVAHIHEQMRALLASEGFVDPSKTVGQLMQEYSQNSDFFYEQTDDGRKQCIAGFQLILERCRKQLHPLFDLKPSKPVIMQPVPLHAQEGAPGGYYCSPSLDGTRPGIFFVNLRDMKEVPKYGMETLAVHEAEPGHHFQLALQQELDIHILHKVRETDMYMAYVEGWALYVEKLAYEQGFYPSTASKLGHFQDELLRAVRLVIDPGIHKKRWTLDQAIDYMEQVTGYHRNTVVTEVERYSIFPGQACAYKIGQIKILELRQRVKDALGDNFDIRQFHNVILKTGAVPLVVLENVVDQYIWDKTQGL